MLGVLTYVTANRGQKDQNQWPGKHIAIPAFFDGDNFRKIELIIVLG